MKILGLDIGIASVGYSVVEYDDENYSGEIIKTGVRVFDACEVAKTKAPLNAERRIFRGARRRLARRSYRLRAIKQLFVSNELLSEYEIENLFCTNKNKIDTWTLRKEALSKKLTIEEFYRILHQIAKRRGFKSIRKSEEANREGDLLKNIGKNKAKFEESKFQTIGEMFATIYEHDAKRNKRDDYKNSISRDLLEEEIKIIFEKQRNFGAEFANKDFENEYSRIAFYQRPLQSMERMVGTCQFEKEERRAPKASYTAEIFVAVQKLVNTKLITCDGITLDLDEEQIEILLKSAHQKSKLSYKQARKELDLHEATLFKGLQYGKKTKDKKTGELVETNPEDATLIELKKYHEFEKAIKSKLGEEFLNNIDNQDELFDEIAIALTYEKSDELITKRLLEKGVSQEIIDCVKDLSASKVMHLSIKAMRKIIPYMLKGMKYNEACTEAGYDFKNTIESKDSQFLPVLDSSEQTTNPVVNRAICQTRKVVNALIREYGEFDRIIIETARDLGKSAEERNKIKSGQENFQKEKELARQRCIENGINPDSKNNLLRYRLWEEQGGFCPYSKKEIDIRRLSEENYTDIDHIIPYSRCFDDSLNNKVLCLSDENRMKGSKIPFEYLGEKYNWEEYCAWVRSLNLRPAKTNRLIRTSYSKDDNQGFSSKNINDTRYITIFIKDYIQANLNSRVETRNGSLTAFLRNQWGITKIREENDRHHAIDATIVACSTKGMVKFLSTISAQREDYDFINNMKPRFKKPWATFIEDLEKSVGEIFVSRAPRNKIPGGMHKATIRSPKHLDEGFTTLKTPIQNIKLKDLENMFDKERNIVIYNLLKERLEQFDDNPAKAFAVPVDMPLSEVKKEAGIKPHQIKTIKIISKGTSGICVHNGFADNDSMPRVDVFSKKNKKGKDEFYLVPIYVADFAKGILPNKAIATGKSGWVEMDGSYEFKFSLFKDNLILINETGKQIDNKFYYYKGVDIDSARITLINTDNTNRDTKIRKSARSLYSFKKYQVDVLGNYYEVKKEKRQGIKLKNTKKRIK